MKLARRDRICGSQSGQAVIETALTLPLVVFLMLGTLQLFMLTHGRILAQLAAYRATRVASTNEGSCKRMLDAALITVMPAVDPFLGHAGASAGAKLAAAYAKRKTNRYADSISGGGAAVTFTGAVVWIDRNFVGAGFDQPQELMRLESRLVFWFPMRIPFANWVMSRIFLAHLSLQPYVAENPLLMTQRADWTGSEGHSANSDLDAAVLSELATRVARGEYVFPIHATYSMRMMTPLKVSNAGGACL